MFVICRFFLECLFASNNLWIKNKGRGLQHVGVDGEADVRWILLLTDSWDVTTHLFKKQQRKLWVEDPVNIFCQFKIEFF